jgi:hypothetical protein
MTAVSLLSAELRLIAVLLLAVLLPAVLLRAALFRPAPVCLLPEVLTATTGRGAAILIVVSVRAALLRTVLRTGAATIPLLATPALRPSGASVRASLRARAISGGVEAFLAARALPLLAAIAPLLGARVERTRALAAAPLLPINSA